MEARVGIERIPPSTSHSKSIVYGIADALIIMHLRSLSTITPPLFFLTRFNPFKTVFAGTPAGTFFTEVPTIHLPRRSPKIGVPKTAVPPSIPLGRLVRHPPDLIKARENLSPLQSTVPPVRKRRRRSSNCDPDSVCFLLRRWAIPLRCSRSRINQSRYLNLRYTIP